MTLTPAGWGLMSSFIGCKFQPYNLYVMEQRMRMPCPIWLSLFWCTWLGLGGAGFPHQAGLPWAVLTTPSGPDYPERSGIPRAVRTTPSSPENPKLAGPPWSGPVHPKWSGPTRGRTTEEILSLTIFLPILVKIKWILEALSSIWGGFGFGIA